MIKDVITQEQQKTGRGASPCPPPALTGSADIPRATRTRCGPARVQVRIVAHAGSERFPVQLPQRFDVGVAVLFAYLPVVILTAAVEAWLLGHVYTSVIGNSKALPYGSAHSHSMPRSPAAWLSGQSETSAGIDSKMV